MEMLLVPPFHTEQKSKQANPMNASKERELPLNADP
jgi:hypothetical protein